MNARYILLAAMISLTGGRAMPRELSLKEALVMAESHSHQLKAAKAEAEAFRQELKAATAERLPTVSLSGVASYKDEVPKLEIQLPTGQTFSRDFGFNETYQADLRLSLPLFAGGKISGGVALAQAARDYHEALSRASLDEVLLVARVGYFSLYRANRLLAAAAAGLERAEIISRDVQSLFDAGAADSVDLLEVRLLLTDARLRRRSAESMRRQCQIELAVMLGLDPSEELAISFEPPPPSSPDSGFTAIDEDKPELAAASSAVRMSRQALRLSRSSYFPTVVAFGGYSWGKPNIDPFHDEFNDYLTVGATLSWSFNLGGRPIRSAAAAGHRLRTAEHQFNRTRERLERRGRVALENLRLTFDRFESASENFETARDNYRLAGVKHRQGVLSSNRLLEIEASLQETEASLASARAEFYIIQSQYYYEIGSRKLREGW